ncbi:MAG: CoA transferase [Deltaproteobacteria bacterium]|nr:CoA transferase [Deltaproteobacteria bacterium]
MSENSSPFSGLRILDLTRQFPGPLATMMLGDLGADVIKIEDPQNGDLMRFLPPFKNGIGAGFLSLNRSKRSLTLNLKDPKGKELFLKLAAQSDLVVEGFRPGVIERLGIGYQKLKRVRPDIILCSISGYGQTGPYRLRAGHDINYCSKAGVSGASGDSQGAPALLGVQVADVGGGTWQALAAIMAALFQRERTGQGQWLDVSMTDGVLTTMFLALQEVLAGEPAPARGQAPLTGGLPGYGIFETADGKYMAVGAIEPHFFAALCEAVGCSHLKDEGFSLGSSGQKVKQELAAAFRKKTRQEWVAVFEPVDACVEPVLEGAEVLADAQLAAREMFFTMDHPLAGTINQLATPLRLCGKLEPNLVPPALGEHSQEILTQLGLKIDEIEDLANKGIVGLAKK